MLRRYAHKLPYVLVKKATKVALTTAHHRTRGHRLDEANHEMWATEVVQNLPVASLLTYNYKLWNGWAVMRQPAVESLCSLQTLLFNKQGLTVCDIQMSIRLLLLEGHVCCVQASKLDRYMQRNSKGKLPGSAIHNYRANFRPTPDSYDSGNRSFHMRRLLLKAEPQSGKTGSIQLQDVGFVMSDIDTCLQIT